MDPLHQLLQDHGPNGWTVEGDLGTHPSGYRVKVGFSSYTYLLASPPGEETFSRLTTFFVEGISTLPQALSLVQRRLNLKTSRKIQAALTKILLDADYSGTWHVVIHNWGLVLEQWGSPFTFQGQDLVALIGQDLYQKIQQHHDLFWPDPRPERGLSLSEESFYIRLPASAHQRLEATLEAFLDV